MGAQYGSQDLGVNMSGCMIVTGGDEAYAQLIEELVQSIRDKERGRGVAIGILDGGLSGQTVRRLENVYGCRVVSPEWQYELSRSRIRGRDYLRVELGKAFLDRYFPEQKVLVWIDADAWVQEWEAVEWLVDSAGKGNLAIVSQISRLSDKVVRVKWSWLGAPVVKGILYKNARRAGLSREVQRQLVDRPTLNAGVYALRQDAPHWDYWRKHQARVLRQGSRIFTASQLAIGLMAYVDKLPYEALPETCNYMGPWRIDMQAGCFVEYYTPNRVCGIVHLCAQDEMRKNPEKTIPVQDVDGASHLVSLRYCHWRRKE